MFLNHFSIGIFMGGKTLKQLNQELVNSFSRIKQDIIELKKARKAADADLNELNLKQITLDRDAAKSEELHKMQMKVENIAYEHKAVKELSDTIAMLKKDSVMRNEFIRKADRTSSEIAELKKEIKNIKKSKDAVKESRIKELESSLLKLDDVKKSVMADVKRKYLDAEEVASEIKPIKKEFLDLYNKVNKIRREVLKMPKLNFFANLCLMIALISFAGAAGALYMSYFYAANFFGIEGIIFFVLGAAAKLFAAFGK